MSRTIVTYVDPAFTMNVNASATGIATVARYSIAANTHKYVLLGLENYHLKCQSGNSVHTIGLLASYQIINILLTHRNCFDEIIVVVEANSNAGEYTM